MKLSVSAPETACADLHTAANGLLHIAPSEVGAGATANAPDGISWAIAQKFGVGLIHTILAVDCIGRAWVEGYDGVTWNGWKPLATAAPPQEFELPLAEGMQPVPAYGSNKYRKNQFNEVGITISVTKTDVGTNDIENTSLLATLPAGFRPATMISGAAYVDRGEESVVYPAFILIYPDGSVRINQSNDVSCSLVIASMSFLAAG